MNATRNLETLDCKDTGCQKIDLVIYLRTSAMKVGEKRRQDAREELASIKSDEMREKKKQNQNRMFFSFSFSFSFSVLYVNLTGW